MALTGEPRCTCGQVYGCVYPINCPVHGSANKLGQWGKDWYIGDPPNQSKSWSWIPPRKPDAMRPEEV